MHLSPRVQAARNVVARTPTVLPNPFGEAVAASSEQLVDMVFQSHRLGLQRERLDLQRERTESLKERRDFMQDMQWAEMLGAMAEPGVPLGEQPVPIQQGMSRVFGRDVSQDPTLANVTPNPLDPRDKLLKMKFDTIDRLETLAEEGESEDVRQQAAEQARVFRERMLLDGETLTEARESESTARQGLRVNQQIEQVGDRIASGEAADWERRLYRNIIAEKTGTPFRIEVPLPGGGSTQLDDDVASTMASQWWQVYREGLGDDRDQLSSMAESLVEGADSMGFSIDERLATNIVTAAAQGDMETLEGIMETGPAARMAVDLSLRGKSRADGFGQIWLDNLDRIDPRLGAYVRHGLGQLQNLRQSGLPREQLLEEAKNQEKGLERVAEDIPGVEPEDIPMIGEPSRWVDISLGAAGGAGLGAGIGSIGGPPGSAIGALGMGLGGAIIGGATSGGTEFRPGQIPSEAERTPTLEELFGQEQGTAQDSALAERDENLADIIADINIGRRELNRELIEEEGLTRQEVILIRRATREGQE